MRAIKCPRPVICCLLGILFSASAISRLHADTFTVTDQSEFDAAIAIATGAGRSDTVVVDAQVIHAGPALMLPAAATSIAIEFHGSSSGSGDNPTFNVGFGNTGALSIADGTTLDFYTDNGVARFNVGRSDGVNAGSGTVTMTGGLIEARPAIGGSYFAIDVGRGTDSVGVFNQSGGAFILAGGAFQIGVVGATGTYTMTNDAFVDMAHGTIYIGNGVGGDGTVHISDDAKFVMNETPSASGQIYIGDNGGHGTVVQDGAGSVVILNSPNGVNLGYGTTGGGVGEYYLSAGQLQIGGGTGSNVGLNLGRSADTTGRFFQSGGEFTLDQGQIRFGPGTALLEMTGGIMRIGVANPFAVNNAGSYQFNWGGGTIQALTGFNAAVDIELLAGSAPVFDTNGFDVTLNGVLSGDGALNKTGDGLLLLNAANTFAGGTHIADGILRLGPSGALNSGSAVSIDAGAQFDLNGAVQTVGVLSGAGDIMLGTGLLKTDTAMNSEFSGMISGKGGFEKAGAGRFTMSGTGTYTGDTIITDGEYVLDGTLASAVAISSGARLSGNGSAAALIIGGGATIGPGHSAGTLHVTNNAWFSSGSIYEVDIDPSGISDNIDIGGSVTIQGGEARIIAAPGSYSALMSYTILTAAAGRTGEFDSVSSDFLFLTPHLEYDTNNVYVRFARSAVAFEDIAETYNERSVARTIDQLPPSDPLSQLMSGQTASSAREALNELSGEVYASTQNVFFNQAQFTRGIIGSRMVQSSYASFNSAAGNVASAALAAGGPTTVALRSGSFSDPMGHGPMALGMGDADSAQHTAAMPIHSDDPVFWAQGFGSWGRFDGNGNAATLDRNIGGFMTGIDAGFEGNWRAGIAAGYSRSNVSVAARTSSSDVDSYTLAAYAGGDVGSFALRAAGAWTWNDIDASRIVAFPGFLGTETAGYDGDTVQLFGEIAHPFVFATSAVEPFAGLAWVHLSTDSFTESGNTIASLRARGRNSDVGYSTLGMRAATTFAVDGVLLTPRASAAWQYAFGDTRPDAALAFASSGAAFGILGVPLARSSALLEAGVDVQIDEDVVLGLSYVGQLAGDLQDNGVQGKVLWKF
ncbi:autotransporter domain-containing protein [Hyphomicrobium sp. D-2]|uniref:autotransporter family protein n=1 Tax=Hyphomicrobium sp. D-2 TaxID=3041621 RepID=UPI002456B15F|nr:autotransporter domain-containing protein [Hyphomicrobium sp. D-2]MDH4980996.1 autotransporter domain-containing protein [Hyphomicrobium sp. D-2]